MRERGRGSGSGRERGRGRVDSVKVGGNKEDEAVVLSGSKGEGTRYLV